MRLRPRGGVLGRVPPPQNMARGERGGRDRERGGGGCHAGSGAGAMRGEGGGAGERGGGDFPVVRSLDANAMRGSYTTHNTEAHPLRSHYLCEERTLAGGKYEDPCSVCVQYGLLGPFEFDGDVRGCLHSLHTAGEEGGCASSFLMFSPRPSSRCCPCPCRSGNRDARRRDALETRCRSQI